MKLMTILFLLVITPLAIAQNEWWKSETQTTKQEQKAKEKLSRNALIQTSLNDSVKESAEIKPGQITVVKNPAVEKLIQFKSATIPPNTQPVMEGYRIQLFFDQDRGAVNKSRSELLQIKNDAATYIQYRAPNYLLLVGDFRSQLEAEKVRASLIGEFPEAIIIEDKIHFPKIKDFEQSEETE